MRTADERAVAHNNKFAPLTGGEFRPYTDAERAAYEAGKADGEQNGFTRGAIWATAQMLTETATVYHRIETAARRFLTLDADEAHRKAVAR